MTPWASIHFIVGVNFEQENIIFLAVLAFHEIEDDAKVVADTASPGTFELAFEFMRR